MASAASSNFLVGTTSLTNVSSSRHRPPSLAPERVEGWTEVWGGRDASCKSSNSKTNSDSDNNQRLCDGWDYIHGKDNITSSMYDDGAALNNNSSSSSCSRQHPSSMLRQLTQYRVAWFEQLVLRMNYIPHVVTNSGYAASESTGALPSFLDLSSIDSNDVESCSSNKLPNKPVLIGRNQPGGLGSNFFHHQCHESSSSLSHHHISSCFIHSGSHIVDYLRRKYLNITENNILFPEQLVGSPGEDMKKEGQQLHIDAMAYESMIQDKLNYILLALRYGSDPAWEGVYKRQHIRATLDPNSAAYAKTGSVISKTREFVSFWARYQAYSERLLALHNLLPSSHALMSLSTHGGLAFELFRYNDYRQAHVSSSKGSCDANIDTEEESATENTVHQHHPYSSLIASYGGVGGGDSGRVNVYRAMELAGSYYAALENRLVASSSQKCCDDDRNVGKRERAAYLLGSDKPSYVDALLFAHLAEALCDIHLVLVLAKHPHLTRYFQRMYDHYFGDEYVTAWQNHSSQQGSAENSDWIQNNNMVNALNAFNQIPEPNATSKSNQSSNESARYDNNMVHAIQLMQQIAIHCHELDEALRDASALRNTEGKEKSVLRNSHRPVGARLYYWLMGDEVSFWGSGGDTRATPVADGEMTEEKSRHQEQLNRMKRDRRSHDELWLSGVFMTVVAAFIISAAGKSKR